MTICQLQSSSFPWLPTSLTPSDPSNKTTSVPTALSIFGDIANWELSKQLEKVDRAPAQTIYQPENTDYVGSSELKTRWDSVYEREVLTFKDIGDEGEVWFGEESAESMVEWAEEHMPARGEDSPSILDVGCGNAHLLLLLAEANYEPSTMTGIDYSSASIELCEAIVRQREVEGITFTACDVIEDKAWMGEKRWDLVTDKGTFDAIALAPLPEDGSPHPASLYPERIAGLLNPENGIFLITSCNFTEEELKERFANEKTGLEYHSHVPKPTFTFGGKTGSTISTVAFAVKR